MIRFIMLTVMICGFLPLVGCLSGAKQLDPAYAKDLQKTFMEIMKDKDIQQGKTDFLNKIPVDSLDAGNRTALHWAAYYGRTDLIKLLLNLGADIEAKTDEGKTPILWAWRAKQFKAVRLLAEEGAEVDAPSAAILGLLDKLAHFMEEDPKLAQTMFGLDRGQTYSLLHFAAITGQVEVIKHLVRSGADIETETLYGKMTPLYCAAFSDQPASIETLARLGANVNASTSYGRTSVRAAAVNGHERVVAALRKLGAPYDVFCAAAIGDLDGLEGFWKADQESINQKNKAGDSVLNFALFSRQPRAVQWLLEHNAEIICKDNDDDDTLLIAIRMNAIRMVKLLLKHGAKVNGAPTNRSAKFYGDPPLICAIRNRRFEIANLLLAKGANIKKTNNYGRTALASAVEEENVELVKMILSKGADVNRVGQNRSCLFEAAETGNEKLVKLLIKHGANINAVSDEHEELRMSLFGHTVRAGKPNIVRLLLAKGVDVHAKHNHWNNLFIQFYRRAYDRRLGDPFLEITQILLENGYNANHKGIYGRTALHFAIWKSFDSKLVKLLIDHGADVDARSDDGSTPLHDLGHSKKNFYLLLNNGADINARDNAGKTPLDKLTGSLIFGNGNALEFANELVVRGAEVDFSTACRLGDLPRMKRFLAETPSLINGNHIADAVCSGKPEAIKLLIDRGAKLEESLDADGWNPLHLAAFAGNLEVVKLLVKNGADVNAKENNGHTALYWARDNADEDIVEYLESVGAK